MEKRAQENLTQENLIIKVVAVLILILVLFLGLRNREFTEVVDNVGSDRVSQEQAIISQLVSEISTLVDLPQEVPQVMVVQDPALLRNQQAFFENSAVGDVLVIYTQGAILYRPTTKQIINMGPITAGQAPVPTTKTETPLSLEVRNASGKNGYAAQWVKDAGLPESISVMATTTAKNAPVETTTLFVVNSTAVDLNVLEASFPGIKIDTTGNLPQGLAPSDADLVLVLK